MTDWFRSWHGAPTDPKWLVVARKAGVVPGIVSAVVWALFDYASQQEDRGDVRDFDVETFAAFSGFDEDAIHAVIRALTDKGIIADYRLTAWEKRQAKREDNNSTARVALHRTRNAMKRDVTHGNSTKLTGTLEKSREDTDKKEKKDTTASPPASDPFDEFWKAYPRRQGENPKKPARAKFEAACRKGADPQELIAGARQLAVNHPTPTPYVPQAVTWLNQERWTDEPTQTGPPSNIVKFWTVEEIMEQVEANGGRAESL